MSIVAVPTPPRESTLPGHVDDLPTLARHEPVIRFARCELRTGRRELFVDGVRRRLQSRPFDLLVYLVQNGDRVVTSEELLSQVWGDARVQRSSLPAAILRLRRALGSDHEGVIRTYQRVGYRFVAPASSASM
ncbi:MAG: winged helix-turn-helix domain-containing protein [Burkholderiales bacterium]|nr:winged helix-turn-helix domain-containing protein [Burkholderiales bacterium]